MENAIAYTFERYELKYLLDDAQYDALRTRLSGKIVPDAYGFYTVCSVYYDTPDYALARASIEKPVYKEKLRLRSYGPARGDGQVFVELKKKYDGVVYKRRVPMPAHVAERFLAGKMPAPEDSQSTREIQQMLARYALEPAAFIAYERSACVAADDPSIRVTFDSAVRWRGEALGLTLGDRGRPLLPHGSVLMEVKLRHAAPLWLARALAETGARPTSFSKYGTCYRGHLVHDFSYKEAIACA